MKIEVYGLLFKRAPILTSKEGETLHLALQVLPPSCSAGLCPLCSALLRLLTHADAST